MKVYGKTDDIIVRETVDTDAETLIEYMTEQGINEDFTVEEIIALCASRKKKGSIQCTITSADGKTIYGFCGKIRRNASEDTKCVSGLLKKYDSDELNEQVHELLKVIG